MTLSDEAIRSGVAILRRGRESPQEKIGNLPDSVSPRDTDEAYSLQRALNAALSQTSLGPVVGTKIGCTTGVMQDYLGMSHPCSGGIFQSTVHHRTATVDFGSFLHVGVECEIAIRLGEAIVAGEGPFTRESLLPKIRSVHAAIEIVDDRYVNFVAREPDWRTWVADNFFGAGIVLSDGMEDWHGLDLPAISGAMRINGNAVGSGFGRDIVNGHPLEALVWLANEQATRGIGLPADWIVMLGSVVQTKWVDRGDVVEIELDELGCVSLMFA